ncbi:alpha/beta hydrolase [Pararhizobium sp.]
MTPDLPLTGSTAPGSADEVDAYLTARESAYPDIRPGLAKEVVWANPASRQKTPLAIVYIHGFSASKGEVRPLPDLVARALGANLFYTRLNGHGRSGDAMAQASVALWQDDMREALDIAGLIGSSTLIIATSTGATLATLALSQKLLAARVKAAVFLAPNFRIKGRAAFLLTAPFAGLSARLILGRQRSFLPVNALHAAYWTTDYPVLSLLPVASLVKQARALRFETIRTPALFIQSAGDQVVDARQTSTVAARWGCSVTMLDPGAIGDPHGHVVAGDALSPETTDRLAADIIDWFNKTDQ